MKFENVEFSKTKRAFDMKKKTFFLVWQVLSYRLEKQTSTNVVDTTFKVGLSPSKNIAFFYFNESPLKMMKNTYYILKTPLVLKIF